MMRAANCSWYSAAFSWSLPITAAPRSRRPRPRGRRPRPRAVLQRRGLDRLPRPEQLLDRLVELLAGRYPYRRPLFGAPLSSRSLIPAPPFLSGSSPPPPPAASTLRRPGVGGGLAPPWCGAGALGRRGRGGPDSARSPHRFVVRVVVPHAHHPVDAADALRRPRLVNDGLDAVDHPPGTPPPTATRRSPAWRRSPGPTASPRRCSRARWPALPPCPVLSACKRSAASAPRTSPTTT